MKVKIRALPIKNSKLKRKVPMSDRPGKYVSEGEIVEVELTSYWRKRLSFNEIEIVKEGEI